MLKDSNLLFQVEKGMDPKRTIEIYEFMKRNNPKEIIGLSL